MFENTLLKTKKARLLTLGASLIICAASLFLLLLLKIKFGLPKNPPGLEGFPLVLLAMLFVISLAAIFIFWHEPSEEEIFRRRNLPKKKSS